MVHPEIEHELHRRCCLRLGHQHRRPRARRLRRRWQDRYRGLPWRHEHVVYPEIEHELYGRRWLRLGPEYGRAHLETALTARRVLARTQPSQLELPAGMIVLKSGERSVRAA